MQLHRPYRCLDVFVSAQMLGCRLARAARRQGLAELEQQRLPGVSLRHDRRSALIIILYSVLFTIGTPLGCPRQSFRRFRLSIWQNNIDSWAQPRAAVDAHFHAIRFQAIFDPRRLPLSRR